MKEYVEQWKDTDYNRIQIQCYRKVNEIEEHEESIVEIKDQSEKDNDIAMNKMKKLNAETNVKGQC